MTVQTARVEEETLPGFDCWRVHCAIMTEANAVSFFIRQSRVTAREEKHKCAISNESLNQFFSSAGMWEPGTGALLAADVLGGGWDSKAAAVSEAGALVALVGWWDSSEAGALVVTVELGRCGALQAYFKEETP